MKSNQEQLASEDRVDNDLIEQDTVVTQMMEEIKNMICSKQYKAGDKIPTEGEFAKLFGTGRSSVREAIKIFNYLGILESVTGTGTHVCDSANITTHALSWAIILREKNALELLELRDVIEFQSLMTLISRNSAFPESILDILTELDGILEDMREAVIQKSSEQRIENDFNFHSTIIKGSENTVYMSIWDALRYFLLDEITKVESQYPADDIVMEHQQIIDAIRSGDVKKVKKAHREHIEDIRKKLIKISYKSSIPELTKTEGQI